MAEFSKEYCEIWDPEFPYDFSIEEIAKDLDQGDYQSIICEGFGFVAIAVDNNEEIILAFVDKEENYMWVNYVDFIASQYAKLDEELN
jgi:hypothetical protein